MPISPQLRASARGAYRAIFRAARTTFAGDQIVLRAFSQKTRNDFITARSQTDEAAYADNVKVAYDIAEVLQRNIVQGSLQENGIYNLRITDKTELGSNDTIKNPAPLERPSRARLRAQQKGGQSSSSADDNTLSDSPSTSTATSINPLNANSLYYSTLKKASRDRELPALNEDDLEETFIKGRGPGGQCINKRSTNVSLLHKPTGIRIQCQDTRSLQDNRRIARKRLLQQLDTINNPGLSKEDLRDAKIRERKRRKAKKAKKKDQNKDESDNEEE